MRKILLSLAIVLSGMLIQAQEECRDIIYPTEYESIIFNCCIYEVTNGNQVHYTRGGDTVCIRADAITKDGQYIDLRKFRQHRESPAGNTYGPVGLYNGHDYDYYYKTSLNATSRRNCGIVFTFMGFLTESAALLMVSTSVKESDKKIINIILVVGIVMENIGIPLWISGGIKRRNNLQIMEKMEMQEHLSFGPTRHGVGFRFRF